MNILFSDVIKRVYQGINDQQIDEVLVLLHEDVYWPNGWEGGYLKGREQVGEFWQRQWKELHISITPLSFGERQDGRVEVMVLQRVKDLNDTTVFDGIVKHLYTFENDLVRTMEIESTQSK